MKKYVVTIVCLIIIMGLIPAAVNPDALKSLFSKQSEQAVISSVVVTSKESGYAMPENLTFTDKSTGRQASRSAKTLTYSLVGAVVGDVFEENEVKALAVALHTQLCYESDLGTLAIDTADSNVFLNENTLKEKFGKNYTTLCSYCDNVYDSLVLISGKPADLNISYLSSRTPSNGNSSPKADPYSSLANDYSTEISFETEDFFDIIKQLDPNINTDIKPQKAVGDVSYLDSGEVDTINICETDFSGENIASAFSLPYRRFTPIYTFEKFIFTVQRPDVSDVLTPNIAHFMSAQGNTYAEILNYCYSAL